MPSDYDRKEWQQLRAQALERARHRCQRCGRKNGEVVLVVHHLDGLGVSGERGLELTNVTVMCRGCHQLEHGHVPRGAGGREWARPAMTQGGITSPRSLPAE
jgi:5-methylcytosine-specific restriction endonuclease McrA